MNSYTQEQIKERTDQLSNQLKEEGWDDVIRFHHEISVVDEKSVLDGLLNQDIVTDPSKATYDIGSPVLSYGSGVSFGGWIKTEEHPDLLAIMGYNIYAPDSQFLKTKAEELIGIILMDGMEPAIRRAMDIRRTAPRGHIRDVRRAFLRVLIPVKVENVS